LTLEVEPGAFGLVGGLAFLDVPQATRNERMRDELFRIAGVQTILRLSDGWIVIVFARSAEELERSAELVRERSGAARRVWEVHSVRDYPPAPRRALSPLEVRIVTALLEDSRVSFHRLGRRLGVAASTVERRFERLSEDGLLYMYPGGDIDVRGMAMAYLHVRIEGTPEASSYPLAELLRTLPNHFIRNAATRGHAHFFLYGESLGELEGQVEAVRRIPFVRFESFRPFLGRWMNPGYHAWLARVLAERTGAPRGVERTSALESRGPTLERRSRAGSRAGARRASARGARRTSRRPSRR
jgi:DNA-binding Lrp family transcriptional regulator